MAITSVTITQKNITDDCDLIAIHNPLIFLVDVVYTGTAPESLTVNIYDVDDNLLGTFEAIIYDSETGTITFAFQADDILRGYMDNPDDYEQDLNVLEYVPNTQMQFRIEFVCDTESDEVEFTALHAARQFGDELYLEDIYNNVDQTYYAAKDNVVLVYFYNSNETNVLTIGAPSDDFFLDYDDVVFTDFDDVYFQESEII